METILAIIDHYDVRVDERFKLLNQSIDTISKYIENQQAQSSSNPQVNISQQLSKSYEWKHGISLQMRTIKLDFPCFDAMDALHQIFKAE